MTGYENNAVLTLKNENASLFCKNKKIINNKLNGIIRTAPSKRLLKAPKSVTQMIIRKIEVGISSSMVDFEIMLSAKDKIIIIPTTKISVNTEKFYFTIY